MSLLSDRVEPSDLLLSEFSPTNPAWSGQALCGVKLSCGHHFWALAAVIFNRAVCPQCGKARRAAWIIRTIRVAP